MDDDDTEGVLARLSRGVDNAMLRASPSEEDGAAESMLRTLLYEGQLPVWRLEQFQSCGLVCHCIRNIQAPTVNGNI